MLDHDNGHYDVHNMRPKSECRGTAWRNEDGSGKTFTSASAKIQNLPVFTRKADSLEMLIALGSGLRGYRNTLGCPTLFGVVSRRRISDLQGDF